MPDNVPVPVFNEPLLESPKIGQINTGSAQNTYLTLLETMDYKDEILEKAWRGLVETNPVSVLQQPQQLEGKIYKDALIERAFTVAFEKQPWALADLAPLLKGKPYENQMLDQALEHTAVADPQTLFRNPQLLEGRGNKDALLEKAFRAAIAEKPWLVFNNINLLGEKYKEEILETAFRATVATQPTLVLDHEDLLQGKNYKDEVLEKASRSAADIEPGRLIVDFPKVFSNKTYGAALLETAFRHAADKDPVTVVRHASLLDGHSYKDEIVEKAFGKVADQYPQKLLYMANLLKDKPYRDYVLQKALYACVDKNPESVLENSALFKGKNFENALVEAALRKMADRPEALLSNAPYLENKPYKDALLENAFCTLSERNPGAVLQWSKLLAGKPYEAEMLEKAFKDAAVNEPSLVLENVKLLDKKNYRDAVVETAFRTAAARQPEIVLHFQGMLKETRYGDAVMQEAFEYLAAHQPRTVVEFAALLENKPYKIALLEKTAQTALDHEPRLVLDQAKNLDGSAHKEALVEAAFQKCAASNPFAVLEHADLLEGKSYKEDVLEKSFRAASASRNAQISDIFESIVEVLQPGANKKTHPLDYAYLLEGKSYKDEIIKNIFATANIPTILKYQHLFAGQSYECDMWEKVMPALSEERGVNIIVRLFNEAHDAPNEKRFATLNHLNASQEFNILTIGRQEAYTSTYNSVLDDMLTKLKQNKQSLMDVIKPEQGERLAVFLEGAASYNRMEEVLRFIPQNKLASIVHSMAEHAANEPDLRYIATLSSMMISLTGNPAMRHMLEQEVKTHYDAASKKALTATTPEEKEEAAKVRDKFGILASAYVKNGEAVSPDMKPFFLGMAANAKYSMPDVSGVPYQKLVDAKGVCNQLMVFSNDGESIANNDGQHSFEHWKATYEGKAGWKTEDKGSYIEVSSTGGHVPVHIFANKPDSRDDGLAAINKELAARQGTATPSFQVFVGRGHSTHSHEYIPLINDQMHVIELGSCHGFGNLEKVLERSPNAQIIATQRTGSMYVNDPLLFHINESINKNGAITWSSEQQRLDGLSSSHAHDYMLPDKDIPLIMLKRYKELHKDYIGEPQGKHEVIGMAQGVVEPVLQPMMEGGMRHPVRDVGGLDMPVPTNGILNGRHPAQRALQGRM